MSTASSLMTYPEPLTPTTRILDEHNLVAQVHAADGALVATAPFVVNLVAKYGAFGEMNITDDRGAPRQRQRALVLLVREALRVASDLGITHVETRAPARLFAFAERLTGMKNGPGGLFRGEIAPIRSKTLDDTDETGDFRPVERADGPKDTETAQDADSAL